MICFDSLNENIDLDTDGTISRKPNGSIEYRFYYYDEDGIKKRKSFCGATDIICKQKAMEFLNNIERRKYGIDIDATIPDILYNKCKSDFDKNFTHEQGYSRNLKSIEIIENSLIGSVPIANVKVWQLDYFLRTLTHYANNTIKKVYGMLKNAYEIAVLYEIVPKNLMQLDNLRRPRSSKPDKKVYALTIEEEKRLIDYLHSYKPTYNHNDYSTQLFISLYTGLRMGEVNALKPKNIDFKKGLIHVRSTVSRGENFRSFINDRTKTYAGMRDVPIPKVLVPILKDAIANQPPNEYGLLFYDSRGNKIISTTQVNEFFKRTCEKCDIEPRGQHCLRHTFATRCVEAHVDYNVLKTWLGHTDIHITIDTYTNVYTDFSQNALSDLEDYMQKLAE